MGEGYADGVVSNIANYESPEHDAFDIADMRKEDIEKTALTAPEGQKYLEGMQVVKTVVVPGRIINIVIKPA